VEFLQSIASRRDVAVCELMLVELYLKLRNEKIFPHPLTASQAVAVCDAYRKNQAWSLIDCAPVMDAVWAQSANAAMGASNRMSAADIRAKALRVMWFCFICVGCFAGPSPGLMGGSMPRRGPVSASPTPGPEMH
jgi:hypothetical protein